MAHPHRNKAAAASSKKMRAITGTGGGGTPFMGTSMFKRPGKDGISKGSSANAKNFLDSQKPISPPKPRADRFARGGRTKKGKGDVNVAIVMPGAHDPSGGKPPAPPMMPPPAPPPPMGGAPGGPPGGGMPPGALNAMLGSGSNQQMPLGKAMKRGGRTQSVKQSGNVGYDFDHWRKYAKNNMTPEHRNAGGRLKMKYGQQSGMGRLEQTKFYRGKHKGT